MGSSIVVEFIEDEYGVKVEEHKGACIYIEPPTLFLSEGEDKIDHLEKLTNDIVNDIELKFNVNVQANINYEQIVLRLFK